MNKCLAGVFLSMAVCAASADSQRQKNDAGITVLRSPVVMQNAVVGGFWHDHFKRLICRWLPHCIREMEAGGRGEELLNLKAAGEVLAGRKPSVAFKGCPWSDAYPYNTVEAICLALEMDPGDDATLRNAQEFLRSKLEQWIPIILSAQRPSGYIHSYHDLKGVKHFADAGKHEFYVMGYFIEMGIAHFRMTRGRDRRLFDAAIRCADHLDSVFGPAPKRTWLNGHPGLEYALCRLADAVSSAEGAGRGDKYARLACHFIINQHSADGGNNGWFKAYHQSERPAVEMKDATGHAVRATYFYTAMSSLAYRLGNRDLALAANRLFESAIDRKAYLTGGVGASWRGEAFSGDYDLDNSGYCESCASCGMSFWAQEQHRRTAGTRPVDVQERLMYNNLLGAISEDGENFFYQNPLCSTKMRYPWHACPCCVGNIPRTLFALKDLAYSLSSDGRTLFADHFLTIDGSLGKVAGVPLSIRQSTDYPWQGATAFTFAPEKPVEFTFAIRLPNRAESALYKVEPDVGARFTVTLNGKACKAKLSDDGYVRITRKWQSGDRISFEFPMPVQRVRCDERVAANRGRVALQRGPVVYSFEQIDNEMPIAAALVMPAARYESVWRPGLFNGFYALRGDDGLFAVPNFARLNRGAGHTMVWMTENPEKARWHKGCFAKVSTSFCRQGMSRIPINDNDVFRSNFDFWPQKSSTQWVQYTFDGPTTLSSSIATWFDDTGRGECRVPKAWRVLALQGDGAWVEISGKKTDVTGKDARGELSFGPVTATAFRLELTLQDGFSSGVWEWRVK